MLTKYVQNASKSVHSVYTGEESNQSKDFLKCHNMELMGRLPYSPNLAPSDFFLFLYIKNKLHGQ